MVQILKYEKAGCQLPKKKGQGGAPCLIGLGGSLLIARLDIHDNSRSKFKKNLLNVYSIQKVCYSLECIVHTENVYN